MKVAAEAKLEAAHAEAEKQATANAEVSHAEAARGQAQLLKEMNELKAELEVIKNEKQTGCANACIIF